MEVLGTRSVNPKKPKLVCKFVVVRRDHPPVTVGPKILRRVEAEASEIADAPSLASLIRGPDCLRRVFYDGKSVFLGDLLNLIHVRHLAVEMDGNDRARR